MSMPDAGTLSVDGPAVTVTTTAAGQNGKVTFSGTKGQRIQLQTSGSTYSSSPAWSVVTPSGVAWSGARQGNLTLASTALPETGTYTFSLDPSGTTIGSITVKAFTTATTLTLANPGPTTGTVDTAWILTLHATDSDSGQPLHYTASGLPSELSVDATTGTISGTSTTTGTFKVTVTVGDLTTATASVTFVLTVKDASAAACLQLFGNAGFETGTPTPWTASDKVVHLASGTVIPRTGKYFAWLGGLGTVHTDILQQTVTIPTSCTGMKLSFWLSISSAETGVSAYDKLTVSVEGDLLATYSNLDKNGAYVQKTFNLDAYAGKTVTISFAGTEDSSLKTSFLIDDTAVTAS